MGKPAPPKPRQDIQLTEKELAVLQAIEDLGEAARVVDTKARQRDPQAQKAVLVTSGPASAGRSFQAVAGKGFYPVNSQKPHENIGRELKKLRGATEGPPVSGFVPEADFVPRASGGAIAPGFDVGSAD